MSRVHRAVAAALAGETRDTLGLPAILKPFRPITGGWVEWQANWRSWGPDGAVPYVIERWYNRGQELQVLSSIESVDPEDGSGRRLEYHVSVSGLKYGADRPYRVSDSRARFALKAFGFDGYTEDNHVPHGIVRNYWRPIEDRLQGIECPCVDEEPAFREMQGDFTWRGTK